VGFNWHLRQQLTGAVDGDTANRSTLSRTSQIQLIFDIINDVLSNAYRRSQKSCLTLAAAAMALLVKDFHLDFRVLPLQLHYSKL
jgi:DNA primase catalytic subunit